MKKTYNISLSGSIFHLEEDAANKLENYITILEQYYSREEGGSEIMSDIENRIAELFQQFIETSGKSVITLHHVEAVIGIMGNPEELLNESNTPPYPQEKPVRKLYRDPEKSIFGGVSAGLSAYFELPVVLFRLIFILFAFFYGITLLIYLILWVIIPPAVTPKQKLEMKGERINISSLENNIKNSVEKIKNNGKVKDFLRKTGDIVYRILLSLGNILTEITTVALKIISIILAVISLSTMILILRILFGNPFGFAGLTWIDLPHFMSEFYTVLAQITILMVCFPPLLFIFWVSIKYLFGLKARTTVISFSLLACWITGIILLLYIGFCYGINLREENKITVSTPLPIPDKHLVINLSGKHTQDVIYNRNSNIGYCIHNGKTLFFMPELKIKPDGENLARLTIIKKANGSSLENAYDNAQKLKYNWELRNDTLYLDDYYSLAQNAKWRNNEMEVILSLPENYTVYIDENIGRRLIQPRLNTDEYNRIYKIKPSGLEE